MTEWWQIVFLNLDIARTGIWGLIPQVGSSAYDLAQSTFSMLAEYLGGMIAVMLYFPIRLLDVVIGLLNQIIGSLAGVINSIGGLGNSLATTFTATFTGVLPTPWMAAIATIILLNIALRAYYFAKDIEIAGFKI